jgi:A/G-specific adenine glycosylase
VRALRSALAAWFRKNRRELPWRSDHPDPYAVWLSEIMLQQTTVAAVVPYFERFLERFPTVHALAAAPLDSVLEAWAGLGYYRRARNLHASAKLVAEKGFPRTAEALEELPGIGPYTAGAIASIAFGEPAPLVDGNVARVLARLQCIPGDPRTGPTNKRLWELARELVPARGAGDHNQALMELGALVCTPSAPDCARCPLTRHCEAHSRKEIERFPELAPRARPRARRDLAIAVHARGRVLVGKRRAGDVWGGLWELPRVTLLEGESDEDAVRRLGREVLGCAARATEHLVARTRHTVMDERIELRVVEGKLRGTPRAKLHAEIRWVRGDELASLALPSPQRRVAASVTERISERGR